MVAASAVWTSNVPMRKATRVKAEAAGRIIAQRDGGMGSGKGEEGGGEGSRVQAEPVTTVRTLRARQKVKSVCGGQRTRCGSEWRCCCRDARGSQGSLRLRRYCLSTQSAMNASAGSFWSRPADLRFSDQCRVEHYIIYLRADSGSWHSGGSVHT